MFDEKITKSGEQRKQTKKDWRCLINLDSQNTRESKTNILRNTKSDEQYIFLTFPSFYMIVSRFYFF